MTVILTADLSLPGHGTDPAQAGTGSLLKLVAWLSPAFPVGSFSYSHGLESAILADVVRTEADLHDWLDALITEGSGWNDAVLLVQAWRTVAAGDLAALELVAELAEALAGSHERHLETTLQGAAFLEAVLVAWPSTTAAALRRTRGIAYPVAVGAVAAEHGIALDQALPAWLNAFATSMISVAVRLVPLGQSAGLRTLAALHGAIATTSFRVAASTLDDLGSASVLSDIHSMRHEELYSRVFRT